VAVLQVAWLDTSFRHARIDNDGGSLWVIAVGSPTNVAALEYAFSPRAMVTRLPDIDLFDLLACPGATGC